MLWMLALAPALALILWACEPQPPCAWGILVNSTVACETGPGGNTPTNTGTMKAR